MVESTTVVVAQEQNTAGKAAWICLAIAWVCFLLPIPGTGIFIGAPLNLVALILAIVALSKFGAKGGLPQLLCALIVSPIIYFIGLSIFAGLGVSAISELETQHNEMQQIEQQEEPVVGQDL